LSAEDKRVHVWDIHELLRPAGFPGTAPTNLNIQSLAGWGDKVFMGTWNGTVSALDAAGNQLWLKNLPGTISCLTVATGGAELLVGCGNGKIYRLDTALGGERQLPLTAGSDVRVLVVRPTTWGEQVFAAVAVDGGRKHLYFARTWNLSTGAEIPTWKSKAGPEVLQGPWEDVRDESVNWFEPELALKGYFRTKFLYGMTAFEFEGRTVVALAGPHGVVLVMDAEALEALVEWTGGMEGSSIHSLIGGVVNGVPYVFGGDDRGVLFRGGISTEAIDIRQQPQAHRGNVNALMLRETPLGWVLTSGGADEWVRFWTPDLELIVEINAGRGVTSLAWLGDDLVIGTDRGVLCVRVRWQAVFEAT
jgi:outer membrane protein assembly factor BamB